MKNHHAYQGGLLEHVVSLMELVPVVAPHYPQLDADKLLMGAFLHDAAKTDELTYERELAYTDAGQLIGHMVMGVTLLDDKVREAMRKAGKPFPEKLATELKHMIVSHHGEYEYGSPKLPMTLEAVALHHLDNLDAKLASFTQLMRDCPNVDSPWTQYFTRSGGSCTREKAAGSRRWAVESKAASRVVPDPGRPAYGFARESREWTRIVKTGNFMAERRDDILAHVNSPEYRPAKPKVIAKALGVEGEAAEAHSQIDQTASQARAAGYGPSHLVFPVRERPLPRLPQQTAKKSR